MPEPSTYAAVAGVAMLGFAAARRRRRSAPSAA
ncbi:MAG TPA: PEP-CTERM sorting domain-containing protein [Opitutus sp.]|nr:PEP-CTERM sorting domain-containing protein [Opitutus sp.]